MAEAKTEPTTTEAKGGAPTQLDGTPLTEEEIEERYQKSPVPMDPNAPISKDDPNDKIRAEGPEVADPAKEAAKAIFEEAAAANPEAMAEGADRIDVVAATGPGSGAANTSEEAAAKS